MNTLCLWIVSFIVGVVHASPVASAEPHEPMAVHGTVKARLAPTDGQGLPRLRGEVLNQR
jgi:hypothetical protein